MAGPHSSHIGQVFNERYQVLESIGAGSMGQVFKIKDLKDYQTKALKLVNIHKNKVPFEALIRFKTEGDILKTLQHPSIIKYYDFFNEGDLYGLVMEYLPYLNLSEHLKRSGPFAFENALRMIKMITQALVFIHDKKLVHLDLKPSNVLIAFDAENRMTIKLLDFGFSQIIGMSEIKRGGTLAYMAPEQTGILHKAIDHRADLYALGIILYEILVGQVPFKEKDPALLIYQHVAQEPDSPSAIRSDLPALLEHILLKLISKDPDDRYRTTSGLLNDLEKYERIAADIPFHQVEFQLGENDHWESFPHSNPFVGREKELEAVFVVVDSINIKPLPSDKSFPFQALKKVPINKAGQAEGKGGVILVEGAKGIGKSTFLKQVYNTLQAQPGITWLHQAIKEDYEAPFRTIKTILSNLEGYLKRLKHTQQYSVRKFLQQRFKDELGIIRELFPSLSFLKNEEKATQTSQVRTRTTTDYLDVVSNLLNRITRIEKRLIIIIDNFEFVEPTSTQLLFSLIKQAENLPILFILSYNYDELTPTQKKQISDHLNQPFSHHLILSPLGETEVARLIQLLFSDKLYEMPKLLDTFYSATQGNPSQLRNILQKLIDRRLIYFDNQVWQAKTDEINAFIKEQRSINATLVPLIDWSREEVDALARGSIFLRSFSLEALKALCKVSPVIPLYEDNLLHVLHRAVQANILAVNSQKLYSFSDNNIRYALLRDLSQELQAALYQTVAIYLENHILPHSPEAVCDIARHWERAGNLFRATQFYVKSAQLTDNGMFIDRQAEVYYQKALNCMNQMGDKAPDDPELQFSIRYNALKHTFSYSRDYDDLWRQLEAMASYVEGDEVRRLKMLEMQISLSFARGRKQEMLQYGKTLMSMEIRAENEIHTIASIIQLGSVVSEKRFEERIELLRKGLDLALSHGLYHLTIGSSTVFMILSAYLLQFDEAEAALQSYLKHLDQPELQELRLLLETWSRLFLELEKGNFYKALELGQGLEAFKHRAGPIAIGLYEAAMAYIYGMLGHTAESMQLFDKLLPNLKKAEQRVEIVLILFGRVQVALKTKDPETALEFCETAFSVLYLRPDPYVEAEFHTAAATAYMEINQLEDAASHITQAKALAETVQAPMIDFHIGFAENRLQWLNTADTKVLEATEELLEQMRQKGVTGFYEVYKEQFETWKTHPALSTTSVYQTNTGDTSLLKLFDISYKITTTHELDELFDAALEGAMQISGANHAYLFTCSETNPWSHSDLTHPRVTRDARGESISPENYQFSLSVLNATVESRDVIVTRDAQNEARWEGCESIHLHQLRSILVAPIIFEDILKGLIYLDNSHAKSVFTTKDRETVGVFATQVAIALNHAESYARQQEISAENERLYEEIKEYNKTLEEQVAARTQELNAKTEQLQQLNRTLEQRVSVELEQRLEQEQLLIQQSKMAAMGEMIGMIAHQWRQPLSSISTVAGNLQIFLDLDRVDKDQFSQLLGTINDQVQYLSNTINDFRSFFSPKKKAEAVHLSEILNKTLKLMGKSLENKNIVLNTDCSFSKPIVTYSNEIMQVFLNIIKNAQDILMEKQVESPQISIAGAESDQYQSITISDNAGGVPEPLLDKIFEPYFSTKDEKTGTGLGLYMSKMIVEKHCGGKLTVRNTDQGACFDIELPLDWQPAQHD